MHVLIGGTVEPDALELGQRLVAAAAVFVDALDVLGVRQAQAAHDLRVRAGVLGVAVAEGAVALLLLVLVALEALRLGRQVAPVQVLGVVDLFVAREAVHLGLLVRRVGKADLVALGRVDLS